MRRIIILFLTIVGTVSCKHQGKHLSKIEGKQININKKIVSDKAIEDFIQPYKKKLDTEMNEVLSFAPKDLSSEDGEYESTMGNLLADLCYEEANMVFNKREGKNIDFVLLNHGGIRSGILKGNVTMADAFKVMPFENNLVVVKLPASKINEMMLYLSKAKRAHPVSKQIKLSIFEKGGYSVTINGKQLNKNKNYYVLTSDYLQNGGDNMNFFKNPLKLYLLDYKVRNAIIDYFRKNKELKVALDGRFSKK